MHYYLFFHKNACGAKIGIFRALLNRPDVVSVGVVWDSNRPASDQVYSVLKAIGTSLRLCDVFHHVTDARWSQTVEHHLVGVISYYGKNYTTFFYHTKLKVWVYFDDAHVREVGPNWESVVDMCTRGRYQPLLLLYATPILGACQPMTNHSIEMLQTVIPINTSLARRAITPSPEKSSTPNGFSNINIRRAITPTPIRSNHTLSAMSDYQNLNVIQANIFLKESIDEHERRKSNVLNHNNVYQHEPNFQGGYTDNNVIANHEQNTEAGFINNQSRTALKQVLNMNRTPVPETSAIGTSPTSFPDGFSIPEHLNQPRRRDSGNWSGDRNSASSSSSTTLDNPYLYMTNKRATAAGSASSGSHPASPTRSGLIYDAGYDSYSLSSTDSYPPKQPHSQLAKIPESFVLSTDCERLCIEVDQLLEKSKITEDCHDLETALILCNTAVGKSRAAMDAPYSNPHTMTFARMKHNTCVMRSRSLHRRLLTEKGADLSYEQSFVHEIRQTNVSNQARQVRPLNGTLDKNEKITVKNIEIYATLPKKRKSTLKLLETNTDSIIVEKVKPERESRSLFGRKKDDKDKRSRSEDRNRNAKEFSIAEPLLANAKDTLKKHKEDKDDKKDTDKSGGKKQHKIRRKLLMGGLIRRKNRSMPDLTETEDATKPIDVMPSTLLDTNAVGCDNENIMSGYLSEGHFEYQTITSTNPNLERSKLMRKSFHGSSKQLTQVHIKVPPPPPVRTNSTLTQQQLQQHQKQQMDQEQLHNKSKPFHQANSSIISNNSSMTSMSEESCQTIITCAVVHQEQSPLKEHTQFPVVQLYQDESDGRYGSSLDLPPYPSPPASSHHSRQASEDFPPPPTSFDLQPDRISEIESIASSTSQQKSSFYENKNSPMVDEIQTSENWLKELQNKQNLQRAKVDASTLAHNASVRDIASRFEQIQVTEKIAQPQVLKRTLSSQDMFNKPQIRTGMSGLPDTINRETDEVDCAPAKARQPLAQSYMSRLENQIVDEISEVEMLNAVVHQTLNNNNHTKQQHQNPTQIPITKKKSVSFCDQVILVATADNQDNDYFVPNPILERVLRNANNIDLSIDQTDSKHSNQPNQTYLRENSELPHHQVSVGKSQSQNLQTDVGQHHYNLKKQQTGFQDHISPVSKSIALDNLVELQHQHPSPQWNANGISYSGSPINQPQIKYPDTNRNIYFNQKLINQRHPHQQHNTPLSPNTYDLEAHSPGAVIQSPYHLVPQQPQQHRVQGSQPKPISYSNDNSSMIKQGMHPIEPYPKVNMGFIQPTINAQYHQAQPAYSRVAMPQNYPTTDYHSGKNFQQQPHQQQQYNSPTMLLQSQGNINKNNTKKVSFEQGTKPGSDCLNQPQIVNLAPPLTAAIAAQQQQQHLQQQKKIQETIDTVGAIAIPTRVFNNNATILKASAKAVQCDLCHKKHVIAPAIYCTDCEFYMARFQPNQQTVNYRR